MRPVKSSKILKRDGAEPDQEDIERRCQGQKTDRTKRRKARDITRYALFCLSVLFTHRLVFDLRLETSLESQK